MRDLATRIRTHYDSVPPVGAEEVFAMLTDTPPQLTPETRQGWFRRHPTAVAAAAAIATIVAIGGVLLALRSPDSEVADTSPTTVATTTAPVTTIPPATTSPATTVPTATTLPPSTTTVTTTPPHWTDAGLWTRTDIPGAEWGVIEEVVYTGSEFVGLAPHSVWRSADGDEWWLHSAAPPMRFRSFDSGTHEIFRIGDRLFSAGIEVRAGARVVTVLTSENGLDWTRATGDGFDLTVASIIEDRSRVTIGGAPDGYVMAGEICDPSCAWRAWFSPDGETWEAADARGLGERDVDGVAFPSVGALIQIETGVLAGGSASSDRQVTPYPAFLMTLDGDEWTIVDGAGPGQVGGVVAIARSSAGLVGITGPSLSDIQPDGMQIYWSPDGVTWQWVTSVSFFPTGGDRFIEGLAASGDWFLVYGSQGDRAFALMSPDGRTWTELDVPSFEGARMHSAAGDEHGFVVVGETCTDPETCDSVIWRWEAPPTE